MFVLKHNDSFAMFDEKGNIRGLNEKEHDTADGLIFKDTRLVSRAVLTVNGREPAAVKAAIDDRNVVFTADLKDGDLAISRSFVLWNDNIYEKIKVTNSGKSPATAELKYDFDADFQDLFEIRGWQRKKQGEMHAPEAATDGVAYSHTGADNVTRCAKFSFSGAAETGNDAARFSLALKPGETKQVFVRMGHDNNEPPVTASDFDHAEAAAAAFIESQIARRPVITSSNPAFDRWLQQNAADIALLTTEFETGPYPCAGIPWYSVPFGRDGIITAFQMLWQDPELAKGVLTYLAKHQATEESKFHDSAPGKIMHEIRQGEMAGAKEVPHAPYYGTADATPLFISLAGAYFERTGDEKFLKQLWPHIERALEWIDKYGDFDGDGFVEYQRGADGGLNNQGWKDSNDSISHADGKLAVGSIALCEVQGYVYDAKQSAAKIAAILGKTDVSKRLAAEAKKLQENFDKAFWSDELGTYALALDGDKKPCLVNSSNPGHLLFSGIVPEDRAEKVADRLMSKDMFTGWGIRTLSKKEKRYEPSKPPHGYHNGTVWTHDTAITAAGFARYGMEDRAAQLLTALFNAAAHFPRMRLPELFGGLDREDGKPPAPYPVACNPQAWASASESLLLQAMLGIKIDGRTKTVTVDNPQLPPWLDALSISGLKIGDSSISLEFRRNGNETKAECVAKSAEITFNTGAAASAPKLKRHI
ncbi:MAG: amylo-alpha-1,6-glucosidase [Alphaproteobacteria bacterium]|nr:MAG: amylo-alpha-1,6-glucosidase [Alphaproteobacteria bacterium]